MDPTENYRETIDLALKLAAADGMNPEADADDAYRLAELVIALHEWRGNGGAEPDYFG